MQNEPLTDKQRQVFDQVQELLTEHFDGHVFGCKVDYVDDDNNDGVTIGGFGGGASTAIGLCKVQEARLTRICMRNFDGSNE